MEEKTLHSTHILMFPFVFTEEISVIHKMLVKDKLWEYKKFEVQASVQHYNEYIYFYEYVRKTLYSSKEMEEEQTSYYFEYKEQKGKYILEVNNNKYTLDIDSISMRTFDTQVGILSIELHNYNYRDPESILTINDFSRRLYPQFLGGKDNLEYVTNTLLAQKITLHLDQKIEEDFTYYKKMENIKKDATNLPSFIHELLGNGFSSHIQTKESNVIHIEPIIDDRMFVLSMYMHDGISSNMKIYDEKKEVYAYENNDFWYKYIFVDTKDKMCQSKHMTKKLIKETTYDRWVEWGTLFGVSRYSFVALTTQNFGNGILKAHMQTMYFQMYTLLLAYRASILNFSKRVSDLKVGELDLGELSKKVTDIYRDYINFENNLFFRELTAQDQGIEIYTQALEVMQIEKHIKDLDNEIAELHTYVSMRTEKERNDRLETISELGAIFLPATVVAGILGMNTIEFSKNAESMFLGGILIILSAVFGFGVIKLKKSIGKFISAVFLVTGILTALFFMPQDPPSSTLKPEIMKNKEK